MVILFGEHHLNSVNAQLIKSQLSKCSFKLGECPTRKMSTPVNAHLNSENGQLQRIFTSANTHLNSANVHLFSDMPILSCQSCIAYSPKP